MMSRAPARRSASPSDDSGDDWKESDVAGLPSQQATVQLMLDSDIAQGEQLQESSAAADAVMSDRRGSQKHKLDSDPDDGVETKKPRVSSSGASSPAVGPDDELPPRDRYLAMSIADLKEECKRLKITGATKLRKAEVVELLLAGPQDTKQQTLEQARGFFSTDEIDKQRNLLLHIANQVEPGNANTQIKRALHELHASLEEVKSGDIRLGFIGRVGAGKSYLINSLIMEGIAWALPPGSCFSHTPCNPAAAERCLGHSGPLPSMSKMGSLTALPVRIRAANSLRVELKEGQDIKAQLPSSSDVVLPFNAQSMAAIHKFISSHQPTDEQMESGAQLHFEVHGPFPGLRELERLVKAQLADSDRTIFQHIVLVDTPGYDDSGFSESRRRAVLRECDLVLFTIDARSGRGCQPDDISRAICSGALPSYMNRATLVVFHNLEENGRDVNMCNRFAACYDAYRKQLRENFSALRPDVEAQKTGNDETDKAIATARENVITFLLDSSKVQVRSENEALALLDKAMNESDLLLYSSSNHAGLLDPRRNLLQLSTLVVREVQDKARVSRTFPLLKLLQNVGDLIARQAGRVRSVLMKQTPLPQTFAEQLKDESFVAKLRPVLRFRPVAQTSSGMNSLLDELMRHQSAAASLSRLGSVLLHWSATLVDEAMELVRASVDEVITSLTQRIDALDVQNPEEHGFYDFMLEAARNVLLKQAKLPQIFRERVKSAVGTVFKEQLSKETQKFRTALEQEMLDEIEEVQPGADDEAAVAAAAQRRSLHVLVRTVLHKMMDWNRFNRWSGASAVVDELRSIVKELHERCVEGVHQFFNPVVARPSSIGASPVLSQSAAEALIDQAKECTSSIRLAMRTFNPEGNPPASDMLFSDDDMAKPTPYKEDAQSNKKFALLVDQLRDPTAVRYSKSNRYKLSHLVSALGFGKTAVAKVMEAANLPRPDGVSQGSSSSRETDLVAKWDQQPAHLQFAAALILTLKEIFTQELDDERVPVPDAPPAEMLTAARNLTFRFARSTLACSLEVEAEAAAAAAEGGLGLVAEVAIGPESPVDDLIAHYRRLGNSIMHVRHVRSAAGAVSGFSASMPSDLRTQLDDMVAQVVKDGDKQPAPIFIPSIRPGGTASSGNIFLDALPLEPAADRSTKQMLGLENQLAYLFVIVEHRQLYQFMQSSGVGSGAASAHPNVRVVWIVLPVNYAFFGYAMTIGKLVAEALRLPCYWTIDDDINYIEEFALPGRWFKSSFRRCLLFGQQVMQEVLRSTFVGQPLQLLGANIMAPLSTLVQKPELAPHTGLIFAFLTSCYTAAATLYGTKLLAAPYTCLSQTARELEFPMGRPPDAVVQMCFELVEAIVKEHGRKNADQVASVSIGHFLSKRYGYVYKQLNANYRPSEQRYQFVLHNTDGERGYNLVPDDTLTAIKPWNRATHVDFKQPALQEWRKNPRSGAKGPDRPYTRALSRIGKRGYQVYSFTHHRLEFPKSPAERGLAYESSRMTASMAVPSVAEQDDNEDASIDTLSDHGE